jgi:hypothetical protein
MNINTVTFVAPNLACGEARGGRIPAVGCNRRATKPQAKFGATLRAAVLFGAGFVARSSQTAEEYARHSPRLRQKSLAANVTVFMFMTIKGFSLIAAPPEQSEIGSANTNAAV